MLRRIRNRLVRAAGWSYGGGSGRKRSIQVYITAVYSVIMVVALLVSGVVLYGKFSRSAENSVYLNTEQIVEQVNYNLEYYLLGMADLFGQLDEKISKSPDVPNRTLSEQLETILNTREDLVSVSVFSKEGELLTGVPDTGMRRNTRLTDQKWFKMAQSYPNYLHYSSPHVQNLFTGEFKWVVSLSRSITFRTGGRQEEGVLLLDVNFRTIDDLCQRVSLGKKGYVYMTDPDGNLIYHPQQQLIYLGLKEEAHAEKTLEYSYGSYYDSVGGEKRLIHVKTVKNIGWKIVGVAYMDELVTSTREVSGFMVWLLLFVLMFVLMMSAYMSAVITKPIKRLGQSMKNVERGDFETAIEVRGVLEVEQLSRRFNLMVSRIRELMRENIREQEAKRKSELEVLHAQINPHFLYNTLNSVVRMAESGKNTDVVTMITSLSRFFRISLSKGKYMITIRDELEHIRHYLIIQNIRFKNKFEFSIEAAEETLSCMTLKLILQPLVENAIQHGIEMMSDVGFIRITAEVRDGKILLQVIDNGLGMPQEVVDKILTGGSRSGTGPGAGSGVGVRNVHERLRLTFGEEYGLQFESELEEGTTVKIWLPIWHDNVREGEAG